MHEAKSEHNRSPFVVWLNFLEEVLVNDSLEGSRQTCLDSLWRIGGDLNGQLQETKREGVVRLTSNPKSEIFVHFLTLWIKDDLHLSHEVKTQMAIGENNPLTVSLSLLNELQSWDLHFFSH